MGFCKEIVGVNTCSKHSSNLTYIRIRFNGCCKNYHICFLEDLLIIKKVRALNKKCSIRLRNYFSYLTFDVVYVILLNCSSVKLIEVFTRCTDINIKYRHIGIRIFITDQHGMLSCVHTADLGTVWLSTVIGATASNTLDKYDLLRCFSIGKALKMSFCRSCSIHDTLQLQRCDHILALAVCVFIIFVKLDGIKSGCHHDCSVFLCYDLILLIVINGSCLTYFGADTTFACLKFQAMLSIDHRNIWNRLCKRSINS